MSAATAAPAWSTITIEARNARLQIGHDAQLSTGWFRSSTVDQTPDRPVTCPVLMTKPSLFVGSSTEQLSIVEAVTANLHDVADVTPWNLAFRAGHSFFTELISQKDRYDFSVVILTPDDTIVSRERRALIPRDNSIFELGLFLGAIGPDRVFAIVAQSNDPDGLEAKIMTDYSGVKILKYDSRRSDGNLVAALLPACIEAKQRIRELGKRTEIPTTSSVDCGRIGLVHIFENYKIAESELLEGLANDAGPIRLFFHVASKNVGISGSLFDILSTIARKGKPEVRILHSSANSPLFARDRLISIGKDPAAVRATLRFVNDSLRELEKVAHTSLRRRTHSDPFIWRIYGFSDRLYLMPYFARKNATETSPVLLFKKGGNSMFQTFVEWFDNKWDSCAPENISLEKMITPATPAGTALFLVWEGYHVFAIPKRDLLSGADFARFYGVGGKRDNPAESLEACALREGAEETSLAVSRLVDSPVTDLFRADGTLERVRFKGATVNPRLVLEKREHSGVGSMRREDDHYYMVGYDASLSKRPSPSREIAALLFLRDEHLGLFEQRQDVTIGELVRAGARLDAQDGVLIRDALMLVPHGTAAYLFRMRSR